MSRKQTVLAVIIIGFIVLLIRPEILGSLFALIFLGMIPGTQLSLPFWVMLIIYAIGILLTLRWLATQPLYVGNLSKQEKTARTLARKKVLKQKKTTPKRRYRKTARA